MNKLKEFYRKHWRYKGLPLANPFLILLRIVCLPFIFISHAITCLLLLICQGKFAAQEHWKSLH